MSSSELQIWQDQLQWEQQLQIQVATIMSYGNYNLCVVTTILALDIIQTLPNEVVHIWKKKFGLLNLLYLITRYIPFLVHLMACTANFIQVEEAIFFPILFYSVLWFVVLACTEYLFIIRAVALNGKPRYLYYTLVALYLGEMITCIVIFPYTLLLGTISPLDQFISSRTPIDLSSAIAFGWSYVSFSVTSSRLLLNIRSGAKADCPANLSSMYMYQSSLLFNKDNNQEDIEEQHPDEE
ncbi:hypothetical protein Clacol_009758 [Clathrus columnatus]|uniref:DUF6533 domain-containing protein n=1 Tax=Clathrus columnatus TaxID=1419009 RepID=A0AAV5AM26_9AGAM|nr:hypothetical protein Clacol_009758 [Clathrus columnatus]